MKVFVAIAILCIVLASTCGGEPLDLDSYSVLDQFKGVHVDLGKLNPESSSDLLDASLFRRSVEKSVKEWKTGGKRLIWFKVPVRHSHVNPVLVEEGFSYHHVKDDNLILVKWIAEEKSMVPGYPFTNIGVAALIIDDQNRALVVKEKWVPNAKWSFSGGSSNPGEDLSVAMVREVREETGLNIEFQSIISIRQGHRYQFGSNIFVICLATVTDGEYDIKRDPQELADAQWIKIDDLIGGEPDYEMEELHKLALEQYMYTKDLGVVIGEKKVGNPGKEYTFYALEKWSGRLPPSRQ